MFLEPQINIFNFSIYSSRSILLSFSLSLRKTFKLIAMLPKIFEVFFFFIGFITGISIYFTIFPVKQNFVDHKKFSSELFNSVIKSNLKYDTSIASYLYETVRIGCLILTAPNNHKSKALYVKNTWGYKCHKLIFLSTSNDTNLGAIGLPFAGESREILWGKTKAGFVYAYENFYDEVDWFLKADDDR